MVTKKVDTKNYYLNDMYASFQGEGLQAGRPVVFCRLAKCNMQCWFCDTKFEEIVGEYNVEDLVALINREVRANESMFKNGPAVLFTGGEPTLYNLEPLLDALKEQGYWIGIESNGQNSMDSYAHLLDHITVSPKAAKGLKATFADELRVVSSQEFVTVEFLTELEKQIQAAHCFISPMEIDGEFRLWEAYGLLQQLRQRDLSTEASADYCEWTLSIQTHKLLGIK